jgi:hypothetical protein
LGRNRVVVKEEKVKDKEVILKEDHKLSEVESDDLVDIEELLGKGKRKKIASIRYKGEMA